MTEKEVDVLGLFDMLRQMMEEAVCESAETQFQKQVRELAVMLRTTHEEFVKVGFTENQAFALTRSLVIEGVHKNG